MFPVVALVHRVVPQVLHYVVGGVLDALHENGCDCFGVASSGGFVPGGFRDDDAPFPAGKEP